MAAGHTAKQQMQDTPDPAVEKGVRDTFPASDPVSATATTGARAVPPEEMMDAPAAANDTGVALTRRYPDREQAKLMLETMVRNAPLDRNCAQIHEMGGEFELRIMAPQGDAARLGDLLARNGG
jgi:hypothetical protein